MGTIEKILGEFRAEGAESTFRIGTREYRVFAYASGPRVRWNLYEVESRNGRPRGLSFGIAEGVREALEDVVKTAEQHAATGSASLLQRTARTFRPSPHD